MKTLFLAIFAFIFFTQAKAQEMTKVDSTIAILTNYLQKNTYYPAMSKENGVQGTVVISFKVDNLNITDLHIVKSLDPYCNGAVLKVFRRINQIVLPSAEYTVGFTFVMQGEDEEPKIKRIDTSPYKNFLFDVDIIDIGYGHPKQ